MRAPLLTFTLWSLSWTSAAAPSTGQLLQEAQRQFPAIYLPSVGYRNPSEVLWTMPEDEGPGIAVKGFRFEGNKSLSDQQLKEAFSPYSDTSLTPRQIYSLTDLIKQLYASTDLAVSAKVPPQDVEDGIVLFNIREAGFAGVELDYGFEDSFNVDLEQIEAIAGAGVIDVEQPKLSEMQRGQLLTIDLHGVAVSGGNHPNEEGDQQLELWVENTATYSGTVEVDNSGNRETGEAQLRLTSLYASPFNRGGATYVNLITSENSRFGSVAYRGPVGLHGATFDVQLGLLNYDTGSISSNAQSYALGYRYPVTRSVQRNLFATLLAEHRDLGYVLNTLDLTFDGNRAYRVGRLTYSAQFTVGDTDENSSRGSFSKISGFLNFSQRYPSGWRYNARLSGQFSDVELGDAERMILGGREGLRGYTSVDGLTDNALMVNLDLQKQLSDRLRLGVFYDAARAEDPQIAGFQATMANLGISSRINLKEDITLDFDAARALNNSFGATQRGDNRIYGRLTIPF